MSNIYRRKPDVVHAMFWDGSKESFQKLRKWMDFYEFLQPEQGPYCEYWGEYDAPPPDEVRTIMDSERSYTVASRRLRELPYAHSRDIREQAFAWRYRLVTFYAWGDDQEVSPHRWVVFRGTERDLDESGENVPRGEILTDEDFRKQYEPVHGGYGDADGS